MAKEGARSPKALIIKALVWRFFIAIPTGFAITYYYVRDIEASLAATIAGNILGTFLYLLYDVLWFKIAPKAISLMNGKAEQ